MEEKKPAAPEKSKDVPVPEQKIISLVKDSTNNQKVENLNLQSLTEEDRKKLRAERFGNNETSTAAAAARLAEEKQKVL